MNREPEDRRRRSGRAVQRREASRVEDDGPSPGKLSLTARLAPRDDPGGEVGAAVPRLVDDATARAHGLVQFDPSARPDRDDPERIHALAEDGLRGGGGALPHLGAIQRAFGHHDVGGVIAHVGGAAADAAAGMNAEAYASGDQVAFARDPDLHLAAHEAAHVVQQRGGVRLSGGVGERGDRFERHADEVADRVVRGESAEELLDGYAHRGASGGAAVQRGGEGEGEAEQPQITVRTAAPAGGGHERTTVGVGEHMTFTASGRGSGSWTASAGRQQRGSGRTFQWVAPAEPGAVTITFSGGGGGEGGGEGGANATMTMNVIAPSSVTFTKAGELAYDDSAAGAGMELSVRVGPSNVSFGAILIKEIKSGAAGRAVGVNGYFTRFGAADLAHDATEAWEDVQDDNAFAQGRGDTAATRPDLSLPQPWTTGEYSWVIPYHYRTQGQGASGEGRPFTTVVQEFRIEGPSGTVTVSKGSARVQRTPSAAVMVEPSRERLERERVDRDRDEPVRQLDYGAVPAPER